MYHRLFTAQVKVGIRRCVVSEAQDRLISCLLSPLGRQGLHAVTLVRDGAGAAAGRPAVAAAFQVASAQPERLSPTGELCFRCCLIGWLEHSMAEWNALKSQPKLSAAPSWLA